MHLADSALHNLSEGARHAISNHTPQQIALLVLVTKSFDIVASLEHKVALPEPNRFEMRRRTLQGGDIKPRKQTPAPAMEESASKSTTPSPSINRSLVRRMIGGLIDDLLTRPEIL